MPWFKGSRMVNCLGWCDKKFLSRDPVNIRFCKQCRVKKDALEHGYTKTEAIDRKSDISRDKAE